MTEYKWETNRLPNGEWEVIDVKEVIGEYKTYSTVVRGATKEQCEKIARLHNAAVQAAREEFEDGRFEALASHEPAPETINGQTYGDITEPYRAALYMIRDAIQELFGPIASLESEDAELLRGPEPHHTAEAYISALQRVKARLPEPEKDGPKVVAYMHPTAKWAHHRVTEVLPHCKTDGSDGGPQPLVRQSACQQEVERLRAASIASGNALYDARVRNAELVKALEWYGEQARLARLIHSEGDSGRHALAEDGGKRARDAIRAKTQEVSS